MRRSNSVCFVAAQNGKIDMTFFTHDCFHFTIKGHEELAKGLWNNMFQPEGRKMMVSSFSDPISLICPPMEHPYIFTRPLAARSGHPPPAVCHSLAGSPPPPPPAAPHGSGMSPGYVAFTFLDCSPACPCCVGCWWGFRAIHMQSGVGQPDFATEY
ncbi:hypothetical protein CesoFtcFv8_023122 [Champsocephalus esox]|uniref:Uncharacterized protein n=1 Tax=Champsocephalus esox TaxID=159716 RepID=A0AAN8B7K6_9TELE|nr:hypothetical protein CesoFtcFv8_023122 [Champsocephalus esox]